MNDNCFFVYLLKCSIDDKPATTVGFTKNPTQALKDTSQHLVLFVCNHNEIIYFTDILRKSLSLCSVTVKRGAAEYYLGEETTLVNKFTDVCHDLYEVCKKHPLPTKKRTTQSSKELVLRLPAPCHKIRFPLVPRLFRIHTRLQSQQFQCRIGRII